MLSGLFTLTAIKKDLHFAGMESAFGVSAAEFERRLPDFISERRGLMYYFGTVCTYLNLECIFHSVLNADT